MCGWEAGPWAKVESTDKEDEGEEMKVRKLHGCFSVLSK